MRPRRAIGWIGVVGLAALVATAAPASAQTAGGQRTAGRAGALRARAPGVRLRQQAPLQALRIQLRGLRLSAEQRQQVRQILEARRPEVQRLRQLQRDARQQRDRQALAGARAEVRQFQASVMAEIEPILTPAQQQRLRARRAAARRLATRARKAPGAR
jgi:hypothetical protein